LDGAESGKFNPARPAQFYSAESPCAATLPALPNSFPTPLSDFLPGDLRVILAGMPELGRAYLVGGCVRDHLLGLPCKDFDIEVFGLSLEALARALARCGKVDLVGRSFGVLKLTAASGAVYDFSIPRRDSKTAPGHKGFEVAFDPALTPQQAASRRDFTINALMLDPRTGELLDFFGGAEDLRRRILRHVSAAFPEDPLRVLRGMQFAARFDLDPAPETIALCQSIVAAGAELPSERIRDEWFKWAAQSRTPSRGLRFLADVGWLAHFPEIQKIQGVPQDPEWHPEGDVFTHTLHCCDAMARLPEWQTADLDSRIIYLLATLAHDFGKASTTVRSEKTGRLTSPGHETVSATLAESFLARINAPHAIRDRILPLVANHMAYFENVTDRAVRRLSKRLEPENIHGLLAVMTADAFGRPPRPAEISPGIRAIAAKAVELNVRQQAPAPILLGRHLLEAGFPPGPAMGAILHQAYEAQLAGQFAALDEALTWLAQNSPNPPSDS